MKKVGIGPQIIDGLFDAITLFFERKNPTKEAAITELPYRDKAQEICCRWMEISRLLNDWQKAIHKAPKNAYISRIHVESAICRLAVLYDDEFPGKELACTIYELLGTCG